MIKTIVDVISVWLIPVIVLIVLTWGLLKKIPIYEAFIDGAKDGIKVSVDILPYLVAIIVVITGTHFVCFLQIDFCIFSRQFRV